jgi:hypothetical protein
VTGACGAGHAERAKRARDLLFRGSLAALGMTLLFACGGRPSIKGQVLTPPPSAPRAEFYVEKPDVQSRETGEAVWEKNAAYGRALGDALRAALRDGGKSIVAPPADLVRSRIYIAYQDVPIKGKPGQGAKAHVEVRLQLVEGGTGKVLYSTHTQAPIKEGGMPGWLGGDPVTADEIIRATLEQASRDFASRL